jgi:hypothetical protein
MLSQLETQNRSEARSEFVTAVWEGAEPSRLLSLAIAASLGGEEADNLIARVRQGQEYAQHASRLPRLRKEAATASSHFERLQTRANAESARLEDQVRGAGYEAEDAKKAVNAAVDSARQLLAMYDEGLVPATEVPGEVLRLIERREAEEDLRQASVAGNAAFNERNHIRAIVRSIEERLATMPLSPTSALDESVLQGRLKEAKRLLADAESRLKKAEAVVDAARVAIS